MAKAAKAAKAPDVQGSYIQGDADNGPFTMLPDFIHFIGLSPDAIALYARYKSITHESPTRACYKSTATLAGEMCISAPRVRAAKAELAKAELIAVVEGKRTDHGRSTDSVTIANVWERNRQWAEARKVVQPDPTLKNVSTPTPEIERGPLMKSGGTHSRNQEGPTLEIVSEVSSNPSQSNSSESELSEKELAGGEDAAGARPLPNGHHLDLSTQQPEPDSQMGNALTGELLRKPWSEMILGERHDAMFDALAVCMLWNPKNNARQATFLGKASLEIRQMDERYSDEFILWGFAPGGWWYTALYAWKTRKPVPEVIPAPTLKQIADTAGQAWAAYAKSPERAKAACHCDLDPDFGHTWQDHEPACAVYREGMAKHDARTRQAATYTGRPVRGRSGQDQHRSSRSRP